MNLYIKEVTEEKKEIDKNEFSNGFIECLLTCRFLFDKYIVKREFVNDASDGDWSLKAFRSSGQQTKKKPYYSNSHIDSKGEREKKRDARHKRVLMMQSCLRVSFTSPKTMHWITELLKWLYVKFSGDHNMEDMTEFEKVIEDTIRFGSKNQSGTVTVKAYLDEGTYDKGVETPHLVFNYLDYLLWKEDQGKEDQVKYADFVFEFRNSVEHWYPQHPSEGTFEPWPKGEGVDKFGNLCIIQRKVNSKFSNMSPKAKQDTFGDMISKGSLKLRIMADIIKNDKSGNDPSKQWKEKEYEVHEKAMLDKLKKACGMEED